MGFRESCTAFAVLVLVTVIGYSPVNATPVAVRFPEGITHGYLIVRSLTGETIGHGEVTQVVKEGDLVESHLVFHFKDGSLHDEQVAFSQHRVFTMIRYHLIQLGPSFPDQIDASLDRGTTRYTVRSQAGKVGKEQVRTGQFDLPMDVYNGMLVTMLMNLEKGADATVNILAFTPEPEVIKLRLLVAGEYPVQIGDGFRQATQYVFKPQLGMIREAMGKVMGKLPADFHYDCWILAHDVPSFVQFEGPLQLMGPVMRIELVSPRLRVLSDDGKRPAR